MNDGSPRSGVHQGEMAVAAALLHRVYTLKQHHGELFDRAMWKDRLTPSKTSAPKQESRHSAKRPYDNDAGEKKVKRRRGSHSSSVTCGSAAARFDGTEPGANKCRSPGVVRTGQSPRLTERQQLALLMQMTAEQERRSSDNCSAGGGGGVPHHQQPTSRSQSACSPTLSPHHPARRPAPRRNGHGETPLHRAARRGDVRQTKRLINEVVDVNCRDNAGWSPLHEASSHGRLSVARQLLKAGADPNAQGADGSTPLHDAAQNGFTELVQLLLRHGANPLAKNSDGQSPLDVATSPEVLRLLRSEIIASSSEDEESVNYDDVKSPTSPESDDGDPRTLTTTTTSPAAAASTAAAAATTTEAAPAPSSQTTGFSVENDEDDDGGDEDSESGFDCDAAGLFSLTPPPEVNQTAECRAAAEMPELAPPVRVRQAPSLDRLDYGPAPSSRPVHVNRALTSSPVTMTSPPSGIYKKVTVSHHMDRSSSSCPRLTFKFQHIKKQRDSPLGSTASGRRTTGGTPTVPSTLNRKSPHVGGESDHRLPISAVPPTMTTALTSDVEHVTTMKDDCTEDPLTLCSTLATSPVSDVDVVPAAPASSDQKPADDDPDRSSSAGLADVDEVRADRGQTESKPQQDDCRPQFEDISDAEDGDAPSTDLYGGRTGLDALMRVFYNQQAAVGCLTGYGIGSSPWIDTRIGAGYATYGAAPTAPGFLSAAAASFLPPTSGVRLAPSLSPSGCLVTPAVSAAAAASWIPRQSTNVDDVMPLPELTKSTIASSSGSADQLPVAMPGVVHADVSDHALLPVADDATAESDSVKQAPEVDWTASAFVGDVAPTSGPILEVAAPEVTPDCSFVPARSVTPAAVRCEPAPEVTSNVDESVTQSSLERSTPSPPHIDACSDLPGPGGLSSVANADDAVLPLPFPPSTPPKLPRLKIVYGGGRTSIVSSDAAQTTAPCSTSYVVTVVSDPEQQPQQPAMTSSAPGAEDDDVKDELLAVHAGDLATKQRRKTKHSSAKAVHLDKETDIKEAESHTADSSPADASDQQGAIAVSDRRMTRSAVRQQQTRDKQQSDRRQTQQNTGYDAAAATDAVIDHNRDDSGTSSRTAVTSSDTPTDEENGVQSARRHKHGRHRSAIPAPTNDALSFVSFTNRRLTNPYTLYSNLKKKIADRHQRMLTELPSNRLPQRINDYMMVKQNYKLHGQQSEIAFSCKDELLKHLPPKLQELFTDQERERQELRLQHTQEKVKLHLLAEQEMLRSHSRMARTASGAGTTPPFSVCAAMHVIYSSRAAYSEFDIETEDKVSRQNTRQLVSWKHEIETKFEKLKDDVLARQRHEASVLYATQRLQWNWYSKPFSTAVSLSTDKYVEQVSVHEFELFSL